MEGYAVRKTTLLVLLVTLLAVPVYAWSPFSASCGPKPCDPKCPFFIPTAYVGWQESREGNNIDLTAETPTPGGPFELELNSPNRGVWLGASGLISPDCDTALLLQGWYLIPSEGDASMRRATNPQTGGPVTALHGLDTQTDRWYLDAAAMYSLYPTFQVMAGFRYDHHDILFEDFVGAGFVPFSGEVNHDVNLYLPYVGLQSSFDNNRYSLLFRVIGFPWTPGDMSYIEQTRTGFGFSITREVDGAFESGAFFEALTEAVIKPTPNFQFGGWIRADFLRAKGSAEMTRTAPGVTQSLGDYDFVFDRKGWSFGGLVRAEFDNPLEGFRLF